MEINKLCRTCFREPDQLIPLRQNEELINKIETIAAIKILDVELFPNSICMECFENVTKFFNFRKLVIVNDKEIRERYASAEIQTKASFTDMGVNLEDIACENSQLVNNESVEDNNLLNISNMEPLGNPISSIKLEQLDSDFTQHLNESNSYSSCLENDPNSLNDDQKVFVPAPKKVVTLVKRKPVKCMDCNIILQNKLQYKRHRIKQHEPKKGVCNVCGAVVRLDNLSRHVSNHTAESVPCEICGKVYKNPESLRSHMLWHNEPSFICELCGRSFKVKSEYNRHLRDHADPNARRKPCEICGLRTRHLSKHMLTHTGERPYPCEYCPKAFTSAHNLKTHTRQHTDERPYRCEYCSMAFKQKCSLTNHLKSKHSTISLNTELENISQSIV